MTKGQLSWRLSPTLRQGDVFEEDGKAFEVIYVWPAVPGPIFNKPGSPDNTLLPRKVRVKEL